jgi:hypothetical protein
VGEGAQEAVGDGSASGNGRAVAVATATAAAAGVGALGASNAPGSAAGSVACVTACVDGEGGACASSARGTTKAHTEWGSSQIAAIPHRQTMAVAIADARIQCQILFTRFKAVRPSSLDPVACQLYCTTCKGAGQPHLDRDRRNLDFFCLLCYPFSTLAMRVLM